MQTQAFYEFGPFRLNATERQLTRDGEVVALTPKVCDLLRVLVVNSGRMVDKDELMKALWPDTFVEEGNLTQNISTLRKALGENTNGRRYIETIPKHGYRFVAEVREISQNGTSGNGKIEVISPESLLVDLSRTRSWLPKKRILAVCLAVIGLAIGTYIIWMAGKPKPPVVPTVIRSIAVLPFKVIGGDAGDKDMGLAIADVLITRLSNLKQIIVRPTDAVRRYAATDQSAIAAGLEQKVDAVLAGSIRKDNDRVRVTVQLVRVADAQALWGPTFEEKLTDILTLETSIAERLARALTLKLSGEEDRQLAKRYTDNSEAYEIFMNARTLHLEGQDDRDAKLLTQAAKLLESAIQKDPQFALAHAALSRIHTRLIGVEPASREAWTRAEAAALKAVELDPELSESHVALGLVKMYKDRDWAAAERELLRALDFNKNSADANNLYAFYLQTMGRFKEAISYREHAMFLDPSSLTVKRHAAILYSLAGEFSRAIELYRQLIAADEHQFAARAGLATTYVFMGKFEDGIQEFKQARQLDDNPQSIGTLAYAYARSGRRIEAEKLLDDLLLMRSAGKRYVTPFALAIAYAGLDDKDAAFTWLQKAYDERSQNLGFKVNPLFKDLRSDPRFDKLLAQNGF